MNRQRFIIFSLILFVCTANILAQTEERVDPYVSGEALSYVGKYKRFGLSLAIAELNFKVINTGTDGQHYVLSEANSRGTLAKLFNFKFYLKVDSYIDSEKLQVEKTLKHDAQGDRIRDSEADFDYRINRVTYSESDPNSPTKAPRRVASVIAPGTQDIVTAVYTLRSMDLAVGKTFIFKVSDSGLVYDIPVKVTGREQIKSELGKKWCWKVEPEVFGIGKIIEQEGSLVIWISDDDDRVPVLAKLETKLGNVEIKLEEFGNLRSGAAPIN